MKFEHVKAIFEEWQKEFIDDPCTPEELFHDNHAEDYPETAAKHFLELSEKIKQTKEDE